MAFSRSGVREGRKLWEVKVRGRTGRMAIGVGYDSDANLRPHSGWLDPECEGNVCYYLSTGGLRAGPHVLHETGVK